MKPRTLVGSTQRTIVMVSGVVLALCGEAGSARRANILSGACASSSRTYT